MTTERLHISHLIPASPNRIYSAWLDERQHSAFTGGRATVDPWIGGRHTAWDGFVDGTLIHLETGRRIVMTWRTTEFPADAADSRVDVTLDPVAGGTRVNITQEGIPEGQSEKYKKSWRAQFLEPMKRYFSKPEEMRAALRAASKAGVLPIPGVTSARPGARRNVVPRNEPFATVESMESAPRAVTSDAKKALRREARKTRPIAERPPRPQAPPPAPAEVVASKAPARPASKAPAKKPVKAPSTPRTRVPERKAAKRTKPEAKAARAPAKKTPARTQKKAAPARKATPARKAAPKKAMKKATPTRRAPVKASKKPAKKTAPKKSARTARARGRA